MRRVHPLWRGFWLAVVMASALVVLGGLDLPSALAGDRAMLAAGGGVTLGAFLAALPGRIRARHAAFPRPDWRRCLRAFLAGAAMMLGLRMAGSGRILPALMEGSAGAYAFVAAAWLAGVITVRAAGRRAGHE